MMIGMGTPSSQSRIPRPIVSSDFLRARAPACLSAAIAREINPAVRNSTAYGGKWPGVCNPLCVTTWSLGTIVLPARQLLVTTVLDAPTVTAAAERMVTTAKMLTGKPARSLLSSSPRESRSSSPPL